MHKSYHHFDHISVSVHMSISHFCVCPYDHITFLCLSICPCHILALVHLEFRGIWRNIKVSVTNKVFVQNISQFFNVILNAAMISIAMVSCTMVNISFNSNIAIPCQMLTLNHSFSLKLIMHDRNIDDAVDRHIIVSLAMIHQLFVICQTLVEDCYRTTYSFVMAVIKSLLLT